MNFIEHLKQKPSHVKGQYAFVIASIATAGIALVWSVSLPARFADIGDGIQSVTEKNQANVFESVTQNQKLPFDAEASNDIYETNEPTLDEELYRNAYGEAPPTVSEDRMIPVNEPGAVLPEPTPAEPTPEEVAKPVSDTPANIILNTEPPSPSAPMLIPKAEEMGVQNPE